jgi:hypothetical protein
VKAIGRIAKHSFGLLGELMEMLRSDDDRLRSAASSAIVVAGPLKSEHVDCLFAFTQAPSTQGFSEVWGTIGGLAASDDSILERLVIALGDKAPSDVWANEGARGAALALGGAGQIAIPAIRRIVSGDNRVAKRLALFALTCIPAEELPLPEDLLPLVVEATVHEAIEGGTEFGPGAIARFGNRGLVAIESFLTHSDPRVRRFATLTCVESEEYLLRILRIRLRATHDQDATVRRAAAEELALLRIQWMVPAVVLAELSRLVRDEDVLTRCWAIDGLGNRDSDCAVLPEVVAALVGALQDNATTDDEESEFFGMTVSLLAARALGNLGELARDAIPALQQLARETDDEQTGEEAIGAIEKIQESVGSGVTQDLCDPEEADLEDS